MVWDKKGRKSNFLLVYKKTRFFLYFQGFLKNFSWRLISHVTSLYGKIKLMKQNLNLLGIWTANVDDDVKGGISKCYALYNLVFTLMEG